LYNRNIMFSDFLVQSLITGYRDKVTNILTGAQIDVW
jgi:hypothetical protein